MENDILNGFNNLINNEKIKDNMIFYSMYLLVFENLKENCISTVRSFFEEIKNVNGKNKIVLSDEYKKIENKKINGKKNVFLAILDWFAEMGAISKEDFESFLEIRNDRNKISHELLKLLYNDSDEKMVQNFLKCIEIYKKIDKWWILNIEIPIAGEYNNDEILEDEVISGNLLMISIVLDNIYGTNSYKEIIDKLRKIYKE